MPDQAKRLVAALRNSYGYSSQRDQEAADMIEKLSAELNRAIEDDNFQRKCVDDLYAQMNQLIRDRDAWKLRAEAAESKLNRIAECESCGN